MSERTGEPAIRAKGVRVSRGGREVLHGLDLEVAAGSVIGLMGPSGCGKTTLMRSIVGVQRIDSGELTVLGRSPSDPAVRHEIGYVTQAVSVYGDLSVRANAAYFAALQGSSRADADEAIATVGLADLADRPVDRLSGGQASRASLACALVGLPRLLVLDEPTVGLDPVTREDIWTHLRSLAEQGVTLLVSSHVMDEAARCDSVLLMREGDLLAHLTPAELLERAGTTNAEDAFLTLIREGGER
ncbi:ABC transporter ATP-binding protein [Marihabitans asiaticum]|uniref:ABC-2 type transport system ATP-binding protein n=1 Tax=Marihabitans asiaticum TaxID=415218 RepID=A0A560WEL2_9MICO|nr:ABC transporter ATP-binding protein [Marihabitans asiaticum]TWD16077.1 ABC-2 type transport system ATP-binding protein [Marihabitans asiaticum]